MAVLGAVRAGVAAIIAASGMMVLAAPAQAPALKVLGGLERGSWQLRERDGGGVETLCLGDAQALLQLRHPGLSQCTRFVIADAARAGTVHYSCPGAGHGRTTIELETPRLARIHTSGIVRGLPFDEDIEARRVGACR
ncbi:hypothetical protein [Sphingomonas sp.]